VTPFASRARRLLRAALRVIRLMVGAPDYERYAAHMLARHPNEPPLSREAFARERLSARYDRPGSRCC
jgi:uncharacterized short protein YbdD (DUF466 family)